MKYIKEDLKYIFIRVYNHSKDKWQTISLAETTDLQFKFWITDKLDSAGYTPNTIEMKYSLTEQDKIGIINKMSYLGITVHMIDREKRHEYDKQLDEPTSTTPFLAIGHNELKDNPTVEKGDLITCPNCKKRHKLKHSVDVNGKETSILGLISCPKSKKHYLVALYNKLLTKKQWIQKK